MAGACTGPDGRRVFVWRQQWRRLLLFICHPLRTPLRRLRRLSRGPSRSSAGGGLRQITRGEGLAVAQRSFDREE